MSSSASQPAHTSTWLKVLEGGIWLLLGLSLLADPAATTEAVVKLMGVFLIALGFYLFAEIFIGSLDIGWGWLVAGGLFSVVSGLLTINNPTTVAIISASTLAIIVSSCVIVLGVILLMSGGGVLGAIAGGAVIIFGIFMLFNPLGTMVALPIIGGILSLVAGIAIIARALRSRGAAPA